MAIRINWRLRRVGVPVVSSTYGLGRAAPVWRTAAQARVGRISGRVMRRMCPASHPAEYAPLFRTAESGNSLPPQHPLQP